MRDEKKLAEEYVDTLLNKDDLEIDKLLDENLGDLELNKRQAGTILGIIKGVGICSFLAGLKEGKEKAKMEIEEELLKCYQGYPEKGEVIMFEKEAEDRAFEKYPIPDRCNKIEFERNIKYEEGFQDGAEFGYQKGQSDQLVHKQYQLNQLRKANEWHYVKDGDLPNTETENYTYIRRRKRYERQFTDYRVIKCFVLCQNENGKITAEVGYFDCNKKCFFDKAEGKVIAWKEIVLSELKGE